MANSVPVQVKVAFKVNKIFLKNWLVKQTLQQSVYCSRVAINRRIQRTRLWRAFNLNKWKDLPGCGNTNAPARPLRLKRKRRPVEINGPPSSYLIGDQIALSVTKVPSRSSRMVSSISCMVFITNGPYG